MYQNRPPVPQHSTDEVMTATGLRFPPNHLLILRVFCIVWLVARCSPAQANRYVEITAEIETTTYRLAESTNAVAGERRVYTVVCTFGTNEWRVDNNFPLGGEEKWYYDGTNIYNGLRITQAATNQLHDKLAAQAASLPFDKAKSNWTVYVSQTPHGHPLGNAGVNIPWLAFCSGTFLKQTDRIIPLPVATLRITPEGFGYVDKTEILPDELGLPQRVDLYTSDARMAAAVKSYNQDYGQQVERKTSLIADGSGKFHYEVTQSTNFGGWIIPVTFEFVQNQFLASGDSLPRYSGVGEVKAIREVSKPEGIFLPDMQQTVVDYRFRHPAKRISALIYPTTNSHVFPTNDARLQAQFEVRVRRTPQPVAGAPKRLIVISAIVLVSVFPLVFFFLRQKPTTHTNRKL